jgi:predicted PurR-regulated permease PerM
VPERRHVLGGVFALAVLVAAALLADILATVFFAITVAYLLVPLREYLTDRGLSPWLASVGATATAALAVVALAVPVVVVLALRSDGILRYLSTLPPSLTVEVYGFTWTVMLSEARTVALAYARRFVQAFAFAVPVLSLKLTVFVMVVFALLFRTRETGRAVIAVVPRSYHDLVLAFGRRVRATLFGIYVLQAATAVATFAIALVVFVFLGYPYFLALAVFAAILQFVPVVGPSILLAALALVHLVAGDPVRAASVFVVGIVLVAWLPDVVVRPRLAPGTANLSGSLYFVGFVGGLLTLGPIGVIAGPLAVAVVVESAEHLRTELDDEAVPEG